MPISRSAILAAMPFRSDAASGPALFAPPDPLERFQAIYAALVAQGSWLSDKVALRLAAASLITLTGEPALLASATHRRDAELRVRLGWLTSVAPSLRVLLAAQMVKYADDSEAFADEVERVREMFRAVHLRNGHAYEALAVLVLRRIHAALPAKALTKQQQPAPGSPLSHLLSVYGIAGLTAYFGLLEVGQPRAGETLVVDAAAEGGAELVGPVDWHEDGARLLAR